MTVFEAVGAGGGGAVDAPGRWIGTVGQQVRGRAADLVVCAGSTAGIMWQPHIPLQLPGYRALFWLAMLLFVRLFSGRGAGVTVGVAAAVGTLAIGRSPDGLWGVAQYAVAGALVEAATRAFPALLRRAAAVAAVSLAAIGAVILLLVGWIAPVGQGFSGGAGFGDLWYSLQALGWDAWARLLGLDLLFGAGAGLISFALVKGVARAGRPPAIPATPDALGR